MYLITFSLVNRINMFVLVFLNTHVSRFDTSFCFPFHFFESALIIKIIACSLDFDFEGGRGLVFLCFLWMIEA